MATITGSNSSGGTSATPSITHGLTINSGDLIVAQLNINGEPNYAADNNGIHAFTSGGQDINPDSTAAGTSTSAIFYRVAGSSEPASYSFTLDASDRWTFILIVIEGADTTNVFDVTPASANYTTGNTDTPTYSGITTNNSNSLVFGSVFLDTTGTYTFNDDATNGFSRIRHHSTSQPQALYSKAQAVAGAVGSFTSTMSSSRTWWTVVWAINSAEPSVSQYYTDFSEYTTDAQPSDWTKRIEDGAGPVWHVKEEASATGGKYLSFTSTHDWRQCLSWNVLDGATDIEVLVRARRVTATQPQLFTLLRGSGPGNDTNTTGYLIGFRPDQSNIERYLNGTHGGINSGGMTGLTTNADWVWFRIRVEGGTQKLKWWTTGEEPVAWGREATNTEIATSEFNGLFTFQAVPYDIDIFSAGINGATAPSEPLSSGVTLTAPADASTQSQPITFSWEAYPGATAYQLQIATDAGFTSVVHDDDTLTTTSKDVSGLAGATTHHWHVRPQTN